MGVLLETALGVDAYKHARAHGHNIISSSFDAATQFMAPRLAAVMRDEKASFRDDAVLLDLLSSSALAVSVLNPTSFLVCLPIKLAANLYSEHLSR